MTSKRKPKIKRNNNWVQLKSAIWKEYKDEGLYDWNSKKFNELISTVYKETGKKDPSTIPRIGLIARSIEESIVNEQIGKAYQIPYYEVGKTLEAFRDDDTYNGYKVVTSFKTSEFTDEKFKVDNFEYEGSQFQEMVRNTDTFRKHNPTASPSAKITVEVDPQKKTIKMYVGSAPSQPTPTAPAEPKGKKAKKPPKAYKLINKNPKTLLNIKTTIADNEKTIAKLEKDLVFEKQHILPLLNSDTELMKDLILEASRNIKDWNREVRTLKAENEDLKKQLSKQNKGYSAKPRKGRRQK